MNRFIELNNQNRALLRVGSEDESTFGKNTQRQRSAGFSIVELLIVVAIIGILSAVSIFSILGNRRAYRTEDQAMRILDFLRDANQRALSQRQVMRLEIDDSDKIIRIIDENSVAAGTADDAIVRQEILDNSGSVRVLPKPNNFAAGDLPNVALSTGTTTYAAAAFASSTHPLSNNHSVWVARFFSNGSVNKADGTQLSATLFVWQPKTGTIGDADPKTLTRAITVFGNTGVVKLWQFDGAKFVTR